MDSPQDHRLFTNSIVLTTNPPVKALQAVTNALRRRTTVTPLALALVSLEPTPLLIILILPGCCATNRDSASSSSSTCCYFLRDREIETREKLINTLCLIKIIEVS